MEEGTTISFTIQPPYQLLLGVEYFPEELKDGKVYFNEFNLHLILFSIKIEW